MDKSRVDFTVKMSYYGSFTTVPIRTPYVMWDEVMRDRIIHFVASLELPFIEKEVRIGSDCNYDVPAEYLTDVCIAHTQPPCIVNASDWANGWRRSARTYQSAATQFHCVLDGRRGRWSEGHATRAIWFYNLIAYWSKCTPLCGSLLFTHICKLYANRYPTKIAQNRPWK